ncbi:MAG: SPOR domain-containing protein [Ignavibacteria bacterium]|jgi:cell division protein FtsN
MRTHNYLLLLVTILFFACSSSQETTSNEEQQNEDEIYVFDDPAVEDSISETGEGSQLVEETVEEAEPQSEVLKSLKHIVQVGAYETRVNAEKFVYDNSSKIDYPMEVSYSEKVQLYVIWLPPFNTRQEAESVRDRLWQLPEFKDAFILTIEK